MERARILYFLGAEGMNTWFSMRKFYDSVSEFEKVKMKTCNVNN
jgi:hypothetical protein